jgi:hypothetical protein
MAGPYFFSVSDILRFLRVLFGFSPYPGPETGHDRAERRERNWCPELW